LFTAAQGGHLKVVKLLVKKGANIHQAQCQGATPLQIAALCGHQEVADYLMVKGATFEATGTLAKVCKCCGAADASLKCGLCLTVYYCCKACQVKDWKEGGESSHKVQCKSLIEISARYMEKAKREIEEKMAEFGMQDNAH
jgi:ankyrin repeat protein